MTSQERARWQRERVARAAAASAGMGADIAATAGTGAADGAAGGAAVCVQQSRAASAGAAPVTGIGGEKHAAATVPAAAVEDFVDDATVSECGGSVATSGGSRRSRGRGRRRGRGRGRGHGAMNAGEAWIDLGADDSMDRIRLKIDREAVATRMRKGLVGPRSTAGRVILKELLGAVELDIPSTLASTADEKEEEPVVDVAFAREMSHAQKEFAKALRACGDAPPERDDQAWRKLLRQSTEGSLFSTRSQRLRSAMESAIGSAASDTAIMGKVLLDGLDGVLKATAEGPARTVIDAAGVATQGAAEAVSNAAQASGIVARRLRDDEDEIYSVRALQGLDADAILLRALEDQDEEGEDENEATLPVRGPTLRTSHPDMASTSSFAAASTAPSTAASRRPHDSAKLEALSQGLAKRRVQTRRVIML
eukprot:NODE_8111_length_1522_cov_7.261649.p1 GENE.NODE_8111_length_1522_cov_7.261649~~NODE_8111_length_1522_cov_7.261649.p1  ORF type:complete len:434 (-),score=141.89 NODE_8111_length_1522_cov_7.261649:221-1492(-)